MSTGEIELVERRLRRLLDQLATEEDPKQAERLMREYDLLKGQVPRDEGEGVGEPRRGV